MIFGNYYSILLAKIQMWCLPGSICVNHCNIAHKNLRLLLLFELSTSFYLHIFRCSCVTVLFCQFINLQYIIYNKLKWPVAYHLLFSSWHGRVFSKCIRYLFKSSNSDCDFLNEEANNQFKSIISLIASVWKKCIHNTIVNITDPCIVLWLAFSI